MDALRLCTPCTLPTRRQITTLCMITVRYRRHVMAPHYIADCWSMCGGRNRTISVLSGHDVRRRRWRGRYLLTVGLLIHGLCNRVDNISHTANDFLVRTVSQVLHATTFARTAAKL